MPTYTTSDGERLPKSVIDKRIAETKKMYVEAFRDKFDYLFCERSRRSDLPLDCSHIISVRICQASGRAELAYCPSNIELLTRDNHRALENWSNQKRESWYHARLKGLSFEDFDKN